jgi:AbrB family looped-hinge helix DNA binding protein
MRRQYNLSLSSKGRITLPAAVRRQLGIAPGSVVEWRRDGDRLLLFPVSSSSGAPRRNATELETLKREQL